MGIFLIYVRIICVVLFVRKLDISLVLIYVCNILKIILMKLKFFDGKENVFLNFFLCEFMVFGEFKVV